ncbi:hypothetical protein Q1695_001308 [Nippostrongylus brasiliensis]|nr:hypothetical protein Q1695_001308 [Nippostrongylus brasiliensis]
MTSFDMGEQREVCHNLVLSRHTILVRYGLRLPPIESLLQQTIGVELMRYLYDVTLHLHDYRVNRLLVVVMDVQLQFPNMYPCPHCRSSEEYSMECSDDGRGDISFSSLHSAIAELDEAEDIKSVATAVSLIGTSCRADSRSTVDDISEISNDLYSAETRESTGRDTIISSPMSSCSEAMHTPYLSEHDVVVEDDDGVKSECYKQYFARSTTTCLEYPEEKAVESDEHGNNRMDSNVLNNPASYPYCTTCKQYHAIARQ